MTDPPDSQNSQTERIRQQYERRQALPPSRYDPLEASVYMTTQEKERALIRCLRQSGLRPIADKRALEVGCGSGHNLLEFLRLGFQPENLVGNELQEDRAAAARHRLPEQIQILAGDATTLDLENQSFDIVLQSTVLTSILDDAFQQKLANRMWELVRPGGGVLSYDFVYNNPSNPDVRGVPVKRIRELFPQGEVRSWRLTLAPPISRRVAKVHPALYTLFNALPFFRTHALCWIRKPG
jgi:SAM-dependent methyltransferase